MHNSILLSLLSKFSKKDLRKLQNFVNSPFFNQRKDVIDLLAYICQNIGQPGTVLQKKEVFAAIFPKEKYDDSLIRYAMSFLLKNVKKYLAYQQLEKDGLQENIYLCTALRELGEEKAFEKEWDIAIKKSEAQPLRNGKYYEENYALLYERYEYLTQKTRSGDLRLADLENHLLSSSLTQILRQTCLNLAHKRVSEGSAESRLIDTLIKQIEEDLSQMSSSVLIYFYSYQCLKNPKEEKNFFAFKDLLSSAEDIFPVKELQDLYLSAINYSIYKINKGKQSYLREAFNLYRAGLEKDVFLDNGYLSHFLYRNVMLAGLGLGEKVWVKQFLEDYKEYLYPKIRENFYQYCLAVLYFRTQEYDKAMLILRRIDFKDTLHNLDARKMLLCIYFERDEIEPLYSLLDSFSNFIRRKKKELGNHTENYTNLIMFVRKILKTERGDKAKRALIKNEIENTTRLADKKWLLKHV